MKNAPCATRRSQPIAIIGAGFAVVVAGITVAALIIARYDDPWKARVAAAGYLSQTARIGEVDLAYMQGPNNGPPLVLLHAQRMDWFSYSRVLPALAKRFHVFAVDYPGHGSTAVRDGYQMTGNRIGTDLAAFIETTIAEPVYASGNSSGGLLAGWLAATAQTWSGRSRWRIHRCSRPSIRASKRRSRTAHLPPASTPCETTLTTSCSTGSIATEPFSVATSPM
ncbi:alpha/beta fold hydrolase [Mycobacterium sp.]|uniref:alpha/beta fold hydrolase n=1 Tax=Mycobacterium sp. TaxID=1785 RepID=UPI003C781615